MDYRKQLENGYILDFPNMYCTIEKEIGRGSNAIVYKATYPDMHDPDLRHHVLIKEFFPFHSKQLINRTETGEIKVQSGGEEVYAEQKNSFDYGNKIHLNMLEKHPEYVGGNSNTLEKNNTFYTFLNFDGGRSLESEIEAQKTNLRDIAVRMIRIVNAADNFHKNGFLHMDIAPDNIILIGHGEQERVLLIDYNSVFKLGDNNCPNILSLKDGFFAPELRTNNLNLLTRATDLYSVTAVFYNCLTGSVITSFDHCSGEIPDISQSELISKQPSTVINMIKRILIRGLNPKRKSRYQTAEEMLKDFQELIDRIDGKGITHWAIWESSKKIIQKAVRENPSLSYLLNEDELFPASVTDENNSLFSFSDFVDEIMLKNGNNVILTAPGGMGKTTTLFRIIIENSKNYDGLLPATVYIPLKDWRVGETAYIRNKILENLHFSEVSTFEDARQRLAELMKTPLYFKGSERPQLLLFLDGLNETSGNTQALTDEIRLLSSYGSVNIVTTTRSEADELNFRQMSLSPLDNEEVCVILNQQGLLLPESENMRELLRTPLMLSLFLKSAKAEDSQITVQNSDELINKYLNSLKIKDIEDISDENLKWQTDVSIEYVLPCIAEVLHKNGQRITPMEMLKTVKKCYKTFSSDAFTRAFSEWIGHGKQIIGNCKNHEEWYSIIVIDILWKKLGLLVCDENGNFSTVHQIVGEYLLDIAQKNKKRVNNFRIKLISIVSLASAVLIPTVFQILYICFAPPPYDIRFSEYILELGFSTYAEAHSDYTHVFNILDSISKNYFTQAETEISLYSHDLELAKIYSDSLTYETYLDSLINSGEAFKWSKKPIEESIYRDLINSRKELIEKYQYYIEVLSWLIKNESAYNKFGADYIRYLSDLAEYDADIITVRYKISVYPNLTAYYEKQSGNIRQQFNDRIKELATFNKRYDNITSVKELKRILTEELIGQRDDIEREIQESGVLALYELYKK